MAEQTREYRISHTESIYLTRFGQAGMRAFAEVLSGRQTADALAAKLAGHTPPTDDEALALRFALLGIDLARAATGSFRHDQAAAIRAMKALEHETLGRPAPVIVPAQPDTCRHGIAYAAVCAACDAEE